LGRKWIFKITKLELFSLLKEDVYYFHASQNYLKCFSECQVDAFVVRERMMA
jgi:hypothetical protein